jgi:hypothetical protein
MKEYFRLRDGKRVLFEVKAGDRDPYYEFVWVKLTNPDEWVKCWASVSWKPGYPAVFLARRGSAHLPISPNDASRLKRWLREYTSIPDRARDRWYAERRNEGWFPTAEDSLPPRTPEGLWLVRLNGRRGPVSAVRDVKGMIPAGGRSREPVLFARGIVVDKVDEDCLVRTEWGRIVGYKEEKETPD